MATADFDDNNIVKVGKAVSIQNNGRPSADELLWKESKKHNEEPLLGESRKQVEASSNTIRHVTGLLESAYQIAWEEYRGVKWTRGSIRGTSRDKTHQ